MAKKKTAKRTGGGDVYATVEQELLQNQKGGGGDYWKPPEGRSKIRLIPFKSDGKPMVFVRTETHFFQDDGGQWMNVGCSGEDDCLLCAAVEAEEVSARCKQNVKYLCNVVVRGRDGDPDETKIAQLPATVYEGLSEKLKLRKELNLGDPLSLKAGRDFEIRRSGKKRNTRYEVIPTMKATSVEFEGEPIDLTTKVKTPLDEPALKKVISKLKKGRHDTEEDED